MKFATINETADFILIVIDKRKIGNRPVGKVPKYLLSRLRKKQEQLIEKHPNRSVFIITDMRTPNTKEEKKVFSRLKKLNGEKHRIYFVNPENIEQVLMGSVLSRNGG